MEGISKKPYSILMKPISIRFYRVLGVLTMGSFFLPIVFENIFFPLSSTLFYLFAWIASLLFFYPKLFLSKSFLPVYFFIIIYFFLFQTETFLIDSLPNEHTAFHWIRREVESLFFALLMLQYFLISRDYKGLRVLLIITLTMILITISTTLIGLYTYPLATRELGGTLAARGEFELIDYYREIGIASYGFFYGLSFIIPVLVSFIKVESFKRNMKILFYSLIAVFLFSIMSGQFTTAFLFALIGTVIALWTKERTKPAVIRLLFFVLLAVLIPSGFVADAVLSLSNVAGEGVLQGRLVELSTSIRGGVGAGETHIDKRYDRIPFLLDSFFSSPIVGGGESLEHNWWLDRLSLFGLAGVVPWAWIIVNQVKRNMKVFSNNDKVYYLITMILFIAMGFIKNMGQSQVMIFVFFIVPALLFLKKELYYSEC